MQDVLEPIFGLLKVDYINIDNNIFRLHYKVTMVILIAFSLLVTQKQYFGDPIDCLTSNEIDRAFIDTYCWIQSTFTMPKIRGAPHAGVHNEYDPVTGRLHAKKYHTYYQWVTLFLYLQALMFYVPRYLWKIWEGGKLKMLLKDMQLAIVDEEILKTKRQVLVSYLRTNFGNHDLYAYKFFFCELLNFVNVVGQIFITDAFVGYEFTSYGTKVLAESERPFHSRKDPMEFVFPKVTKCNFQKFGVGGTPEITDAICVLPLNVFNEKIYIILWFWFLIIATFSGIGLLYRLTSFDVKMRFKVLRSKSRICDEEDIAIINSKCGIGDWFLLCQIAKNTHPNIFKDCISELAKDM